MIVERIGVIGMITEERPYVLTLRGGVVKIAFASFSGVAGMDLCKFKMSFLTGRPRLAGSFLDAGGLGFFIGFGLVTVLNMENPSRFNGGCLVAVLIVSLNRIPYNIQGGRPKVYGGLRKITAL